MIEREAKVEARRYAGALLRAASERKASKRIAELGIERDVAAVEAFWSEVAACGARIEDVADFAR